MKTERVVIAGIGILNSQGVGYNEFLQNSKKIPDNTVVSGGRQGGTSSIGYSMLEGLDTNRIYRK